MTASAGFISRSTVAASAGGCAAAVGVGAVTSGGFAAAPPAVPASRLAIDSRTDVLSSGLSVAFVLFPAATKSGFVSKFSSVPDQKDCVSLSGSSMFRTMFGVIDMRISVLIVPSSAEEKSFPRTGMSPRSGILFRVFRSSSLIRPPMITVSPSRRLMRVSVFLVPNLNGLWPLPRSSWSPRVLISRPSFIVTVLFRCTVGSMLSLMPTSLYSKFDVTWPTTVDWTVEVWTGILSPIWNFACLLFSTRTRGFASVWASESCLIRFTHEARERYEDVVARQVPEFAQGDAGVRVHGGGGGRRRLDRGGCGTGRAGNSSRTSARSSSRSRGSPRRG